MSTLIFALSSIGFLFWIARIFAASIAEEIRDGDGLNLKYRTRSAFPSSRADRQTGEAPLLPASPVTLIFGNRP